jgi:hypothetical protein
MQGKNKTTEQGAGWCPTMTLPTALVYGTVSTYDIPVRAPGHSTTYVRTVTADYKMTWTLATVCTVRYRYVCTYNRALQIQYSTRNVILCGLWLQRHFFGFGR